MLLLCQDRKIYRVDHPVDDVLVLCLCLFVIEMVKSVLKSKFEMIVHSAVKSFFGVEFVYTNEGISIRQKHFINTMLHMFGILCIKLFTTLLVPPGCNSDSNGLVLKILIYKSISARNRGNNVHTDAK